MKIYRTVYSLIKLATVKVTNPHFIQPNYPVYLHTYLEREIQKENVALSTRENKKTTLKLIGKWFPQMTLAQVSPLLVSEFISQMRKEGFKEGTIAKHVHQLRHFLYLGVKQGVISPVMKDADLYAYKVDGYHHSFLQPEELSLMEEAKTDKWPIRWQMVYQAFLFSCYTGLRFSDVSQLTAQHILLKGNYHWLIKKTQKTGTEIRLPLELLSEGKPLIIFNKVYKENESRVFPLGTNTATNKILEHLEKKIGIHTHISFHSARHTFATCLLYKGVPLEVIQKLLGHHSIKTTQIYATMNDATLVKALENIEPK